MPHNIRKCLFDIRESIDSIDEYLGAKRNFKTYVKNKQLRRAVERELEIIGEAARRIIGIDPDFPLENVHKIIGLRNRVIHAYDSVNSENIWLIIVKHLPKLKEDVDKLLK